MKFLNHVFWFNSWSDDQGQILMIFGSKDKVIRMSGELVGEFIEAIENKQDISHLLSKLTSNKNKNLFLKILHDSFIDEVAENNDIEIDDKLTLSFSNLTIDIVLAKEDVQNSDLLPIYAKNVDPTAVVGLGGYDDDPAS